MSVTNILWPIICHNSMDSSNCEERFNILASLASFPESTVQEEPGHPEHTVRNKPNLLKCNFYFFSPLLLVFGYKQLNIIKKKKYLFVKWFFYFFVFWNDFRVLNIYMYMWLKKILRSCATCSKYKVDPCLLSVYNSEGQNMDQEMFKFKIHQNICSDEGSIVWRDPLRWLNSNASEMLFRCTKKLKIIEKWN